MNYYKILQESGSFLLQETDDKLLRDGNGYASIDKTLKYVVYVTPSAIEKSLTYAVLTTPSASEKDLKYVVYSTPSAIEKDLQYCIPTVPSATEKDLGYCVLTTPQPSDKDLKYVVFSTVTAIEKGLEYYILTIPAAIEKGLLYKVEAPVAPGKSLKYTVFATAAAKEKDLTYSIVTIPAASEKSLTYIILSTVPSIDKDLQYTVLSTVAAIEKDLGYSIAAKTVPEKTLKYTVFSTVPATEKSLSYSVPTSLIGTKTLTYRVLVIRPKTKSLKYEVKTIPTAIGKSLKYCIIITTRPTEFNNLIPKYSPKAYYRFNVGDITTDNSGNSHTLTAITSPIGGSPKFGGAVGLGGVSAFSATDHADFRPTGNFSISAWIRTSSASPSQHIFQSYSQNPNVAGIWFRKTANKLVLVSGKNTGVGSGSDYQMITGNTTINDGAWHFVVATYDGSYLRLFCDGASDATPLAWTNPAVFATTNYVRVGCGNQVGTNLGFYSGSIDDLAFWNGKALSSGEVTTLYAAELNTIPALLGDASLKAYYRFENGYLNTDTTVNAHTLTSISFPITLTQKFGGDIFLDSVSGYSAVDHTDFKPTGNFTIGCWMRTTETGSARYIFQSFSQNPNFAGFFIRRSAANKTAFTIGKNTGTVIGTDYQTISGSTTISDDKWHFVVATYDGSYLNLYVDGVSDATRIAWANAPVYAATNYVRVGTGCLAGSNSSYFNGTLDDMFLLNGQALTLTEIANIYNYYSICLKYDIVSSPKATKSLKYTVWSIPVIFKALKYTVLKTPTAPTKSLKYTVFTAPAAIEKSLKYTVFSTVTATQKSLKYTIKTPPSIDKDLTYEVISAPAATEKSLKYTVFTTLSSIDKSLTYSVKTVPTAIGKQLKYIIYSTVAAIGKSLKYTVFIVPSAINKSLKYEVLSVPTAINKSLKYCVITTPGWINHYLLQENGDFLLQENGDKILLESFIESSKDLTYCIWSHIQTETKSLKYTVFTTKTPIGKSLRYQIVLIIPAITKTLKYEVVSAPAAIHKSLKYVVTTVPVGISKTLTYTIKSAVSAINKTLVYTVTTTGLVITKSLKYSILLTPSAAKQIRLDYRILTDYEEVELYHPMNTSYSRYLYHNESIKIKELSMTYTVV